MDKNTLVRTATFGKVINEDERTIEVSISSEYPVRRYDGEEVLDHTDESIDMSRFPLPICRSHDTWELNIGLVEDPKIKSKKLRGVMRFGERNEALEIWKDVKGGIIRGISIGYERQNMTDVHKGVYHVTRWMPFEASLCSVPADPTVGVGRTLETFDFDNLDKTIREIPEEKREDFIERVIKVTEKYKQPAESNDSDGDEPKLNIEANERELKLKERELEI